MNQESYIRRGQQSLSSNCCRNHGMYSQTNSFPLRGLLVRMWSQSYTVRWLRSLDAYRLCRCLGRRARRTRYSIYLHWLHLLRRAAVRLAEVSCKVRMRLRFLLNFLDMYYCDQINFFVIMTRRPKTWHRIIKRLKQTGAITRKSGSGRPRTAQTTADFWKSYEA